MVVEEVQEMEEKGRRSKAVAMGSQGAWTKWDIREEDDVGPNLEVRACVNQLPTVVGI